MKEQLTQYLCKYADFNTEEIDWIIDACSCKTYDKKEYLLIQNDICNYHYFILNGLVRQFRTDEKGKENISAFAIENWWITNLDSYINRVPSNNAIQAIEKTSVLRLTKNNLESLFIKLPKLERVFRKITENTLIAYQRKSEVFMKENSKERYHNFITYLPNFVQRVPQYMIASYLDISPEYLSDIRKNTK